MSHIIGLAAFDRGHPGLDPFPFAWPCDKGADEQESFLVFRNEAKFSGLGR